MVQRKVPCPQYNNLSQDLSELKHQLIDLESRALTVGPTQFLCQLYIARKAFMLTMNKKLNYVATLQIGDAQVILQKFPSLGKLLSQLYENTVILLSG